jgi:hypothetical protein
VDVNGPIAVGNGELLWPASLACEHAAHLADRGRAIVAVEAYEQGTRGRAIFVDDHSISPAPSGDAEWQQCVDEGLSAAVAFVTATIATWTKGGRVGQPLFFFAHADHAESSA